MHRNSTKLAIGVVIAAVVLTLGWSATANADPSSNSSRIQLAEDTKANCQLLANNSSGGRKSRALACVMDQDAIIALLKRPSPSPTTSPSASPTVIPTTAAPSPSVSPSTSPPAPSTTCFANEVTNPTLHNTRLIACGYPAPSTTGVPAGTILTPRGALTASTPNAVYEGLRITGCVAIQASNITIRRSIITGPCSYGVDMQSGSLTIEDSEINCTDGHGTGIAWNNFTARRMYIHDCENALEIGANSSVTDSYLFAREGDASSHGDGIQSQGGNNVVIRHNTIFGHGTSAIITNPTLNNGWTIDNNFMGGGSYTLYCPEQGTSFRVINNRFMPVGIQGEQSSAAFGQTDACNHTGIIWGIAADGSVANNFVDGSLSIVDSDD